MTCSERNDLILLYAAGAMEGDERDQLRSHLAGGCPQCNGALAEAQAALAQLPLALDIQLPSASAKQSFLKRIAADESSKTPSPGSMKIGPRKTDWDRVILPAALAAVLAVAVTLAAIWRFGPARPQQAVNPPNPGSTMAPALVMDALNKAMKDLDATKAQLDQANVKLTADDAELLKVRAALADATQKNSELASMKLAELTGTAQPQALGRVFIDTDKAQWYFFTSGMKPANEGKQYELWLIADGKKIPAGTFDVGEKGTAALLGTVPALPKDAAVVLAVTDEPAGKAQDQPTGTAQIAGQVQ